ncbi:MAG: hypothetical protein ACNA8W_09500 [Bradymonadaceae bacterium]
MMADCVNQRTSACFDRLTALIAAMIWIVLVFSGCTTDLAQCGDDGDCPGLQRCAWSGGLLFRTSVCVGDGLPDSDVRHEFDVRHDTDAAVEETGPVFSSDADSDTDAAGRDVPAMCSPLMPPLPGDGCDPLCQTGCNAEENCTPFHAEPDFVPSSQCRPAGTSEQGESCGDGVECAAGYTCAAFDAEKPLTCHKTCRMDGADAPLCPDVFNCLPHLVDETRLGLCGPCTMYPNDSCGEGKNCYPTVFGRRCLDYDTNAVVGSTCTFSQDCNEEQACIGEGLDGPAECRPLCMEHADCRVPGENCWPIYQQTEDGDIVLPFGTCLPG